MFKWLKNWLVEKEGYGKVSEDYRRQCNYFANGGVERRGRKIEKRVNNPVRDFLKNIDDIEEDVI